MKKDLKNTLFLLLLSSIALNISAAASSSSAAASSSSADGEDNANMVAANTEVILKNPTIWPIILSYSQNGTTHEVEVPALGGEISLGSSASLSPSIGIKTLPSTTANRESTWYGVASWFYSDEFTPLDLNSYFAGKSFSTDEYASVALVGTGVAWTVEVSAQKTAERKTSMEVIDAFRRFAETSAFNYKERFARTFGANLFLTNNSYWPVDVLFFKGEQAYQIPVDQGQTISLGDNISNYIAIKARPLTTEMIAGLLGVVYNYTVLNIEDLYRGFSPDKDTTYQIQLTTIGATQDWQLSINPVVETPALTEQTAMPISIAWPTKLGWSQKKYVKFGKLLNDAILSKDEKSLVALSTLFQKTFDERTEQNMVKALIMYYHALAQQLGHVFEEGTFIIYDGQPIYEFLQNLKGKYTRNSSHLNALAKYHEKPWLAQTGSNHFGYDVAMPEINFSTTLFNRISEDGNVFYLKPESHGTAGIADVIAHGASFVHAQGRKLLPAIFGSNDQAGYSKERIPKDLLKSYLAIIESLDLSDEIKERIATHAVSLGIQAMYRTAKQLLEKNPENAELQAFINQLEEPDIKRTYLDRRFGSEAILTPAEFAMTIAERSVEEAAPAAAASSSSAR